jgi:hypothetical protein
MRTTILAAAALTAGAILSAPAVAAPSPPVAENGQHVTVNGDRRICRTVRRTASRMGQGRICRTESQWAANGVRNVSSHSDIDDAQNALDMYGEKVSTNCTGGMGGSHNGPLGPR